MSTHLSDRTLRRLSWASFAFYVGSSAAAAVLQLVDPVVVTGFITGGLLGDLAFICMTALFPAVGILIIRRQPRNTVGWPLHATGLAWGLSALTEAYARLSLHLAPSVPGGTAVEVAGASLWWPAIVIMGVFTILYFPDGRPPSPRWRWLPWVAGVDCLAGMLLVTVSHGAVTDVVEPLRSNPLAVPMSHTVQTVLTALLLPLLPISLLAAAASLVVRFRGSSGVQRLQLKWLMSAMAFIALWYVGTLTASFTPAGGRGQVWWLDVLQTVAILSFGLIPVTIGIAITRYGLYGIDALIGRALVVGALGVFITGVYVGVVVGVSALIGQRHPSVWLSVLATALVAVAFQPVREAVRRWVNRLVYGARATPYEVLSHFAQMAGRYTTDELLPRISQTVSECLGGARVEMWLRNGQQLSRAAAWPRTAALDAPVWMPDPDALPDLPADRLVPVRHRGELLGAIGVTRSAAEPLIPTEEEMLARVASQTGLVLRNLRLVEDLHSSRQRLVTSQDQQRRRLERDLHDGAQQSLVAVALMLRMAAEQRDPDVIATRIGEAAEQLQVAIADLRELARGIHPAILTDRGLGPAVASLAERCPVPVRVDDRLARRLPAPVEGTLYFVVAESLTNVAKYAHAHLVTVTLRDLGDTVGLEVVDDGVGGADASAGSGLLGLADRVSVVDGTFALHSPPGQGTRIECVVPAPGAPAVAAPLPAAARRVSEPAL